LDARQEPIDAGLALFFPAPHSYTGEDVLELQVHGSPVVARETLTAVLEAGARLAAPGEFTRRAFLNGKLDLSAAEAVADLIDAESRSAARAAHARLAGGLQTRVAEVRAELAAILEELTATLDFPDEVVEPPRERLRAELELIRNHLALMSASWEIGRLVREGPSVAIVGPPNAGKSSLLNALLGDERALVSDTAGTTRDTIEESFGVDGIRVRLIDTAGIREHADQLEAAGIARTERTLEQARLALVVVDGSRALQPDEMVLLARTRAKPRMVIFNKRDLGSAGYDAREVDEKDALFVSVLDSEDVAKIRETIRRVFAVDNNVDLERPHLATARQADCALAAQRAVMHAAQTLADGQPIDLIAPDLVEAYAALGELTGDAVTEEVLDGIFARFCIGK
ncbi:MAG: tRNA uridine-5-carboxymethylaminomethyl(34) synthesis GTPase MnmE, partial [Vulcanimicrobiaceae bacterium]